MPNEPIPGCVILTSDNVERIIEVAAKRKFTIEHLRDSLEYNAEEGDGTLLYTSVYPWIPQISNFNDVPYDPSVPVDYPHMMSTEEFLELLESTPEIP
jgi:hypothetical protein